MKKFALLLLFLVSTAYAGGVSLVGSWRSDDQSGGADNGTMIFGKDGSLVLAPDGFAPIKGRYTVSGDAITADMGSNGKTTIHYQLDATSKKLTARYIDGRKQSFNRIDNLKK